MGIIISLLIMWLMFKILQWAFSSLSDSNNDKETSNHDDRAIDSNNNEEPSSYNVGPIDSDRNKDTSNNNVGAIDSKPSDLKYKNEVYISFRDKVQKAYESYKKSGYNITWDSNADGFFILEDGSISDGSSMYSVNVHHDDRYSFEYDDPFCIVVTYGVFFERSDYNDHKEKAEYLNNYFKKIERPGIFYTVETMGDSNLGVCYCHVVANNNNILCKKTKELGEAELFKQLISEAREFYYEGEELYGDKETSSNNVRAIDNEPSDLKYDNEVYMSFRDKVKKAYESYKESGHNIEWNSDIDGFILSEACLPTGDRLVYMVNVVCDDQKLFKLDNPFRIIVSYGRILENSYYGLFEEQVEYLNDYIEHNEKPGIFFTLSTVGNSNMRAYFCNFAVSNNNNLCKRTEEIGEAELFKQLMSDVRQAYYNGRELYWDKLERDKEKNSFI